VSDFSSIDESLENSDDLSDLARGTILLPKEDSILGLQLLLNQVSDSYIVSVKHTVQGITA
jgi:hypothetical protein